MTILKIIVLGFAIIGVLQLPIKYLKVIGPIAWAAFSLLGCLKLLDENFGTSGIIFFIVCAFVSFVNMIAFIGKPACLGGKMLSMARKGTAGKKISTGKIQPMYEYRIKAPKGMKVFEWIFWISFFSCCFLTVPGLTYVLEVMIFPNYANFTVLEWGTVTIIGLGIGLAGARLLDL